MSSSPTARTSTTGSSSFSLSRADVAVIACGAIAQPCADVVARHGWSVDVHPLPPLLHNRPDKIAGAVKRLADELSSRYRTIAVGYADCGTYGALDEVCARLGLRRLAGLHCYDLYAGADRMREMFEREPGTYVLTDFLVRSFDRTVVAELGIDRHPELREDYFGNYTRVVWLRQSHDALLEPLAQSAADRLGLPLAIVDTGTDRLESALEDLLDG
jgi:hypothetical protein